MARLRTAYRLTQERLAELSGIHPRYLQRIEQGTVAVSLEVLLRIRRALKCPIEDLVKNAE